jgi:hypothetical protein
MSYYIRKIQEGRMVTKRRRSAASTSTPSSALQAPDRRKVRGGAGSKIGDHATLSDPGHGAGDSGVTGDARKLKSGERSPMGNVPRDSEGRSSLRVVKRAGGVMADVATGSGNRAERRKRRMGITEALYNALCDLGDLISEAYRKPKSGEKVKGRGPVKLGDMPLFLRGTSGYEGRDPMRAKARMKKNIAMQDAPAARKGTVASKAKKHYAKLHKRANAGDIKAKELLRRAEMSDTD